MSREFCPIVCLADSDGGDWLVGSMRTKRFWDLEQGVKMIFFGRLDCLVSFQINRCRVKDVVLHEALSKTMESEAPIVRQQRDSSSSGLFRDAEAWNNDLGNGFRRSNRPLLHSNALDIEIKAENVVKSTF
ncbi:hypothetical protein WH47_03816 [Habropoda laboriosa]|uniref:Uncharacterized protein n=1 Tax=Habropoda laboriosa TaxID=597456 RepID=A0A0L7QUU6_9HYME|nr:hypothetical protein WH47_03816 [Habropoda laboriosa]